MAYTISVHCGHAVHRGHNIRDARAIKNQAHIDRSGKFEIWADATERQAYHMLFDKALANYNERQSLSSRQIKDYYNRVRDNQTQHTSYEMIIAVGNKDNPPDSETARQIMREFFEGWQLANPNMHLFGAYYHADEEGVPHVHLDYIPYAQGFKRGMETRTSYNKALDAMGFHGRDSLAKWCSGENQRLENICRQHGLDIEHPDRGKGVEHKETQLFRVEKELAATTANLEEKAAELTAVKKTLGIEKGKLTRFKTRAETEKYHLERQLKKEKSDLVFKFENEIEAARESHEKEIAADKEARERELDEEMAKRLEAKKQEFAEKASREAEKAFADMKQAEDRTTLLKSEYAALEGFIEENRKITGEISGAIERSSFAEQDNLKSRRIEIYKKKNGFFGEKEDYVGMPLEEFKRILQLLNAENAYKKENETLKMGLERFKESATAKGINELNNKIRSSERYADEHYKRYQDAVENCRELNHKIWRLECKNENLENKNEKLQMTLNRALSCLPEQTARSIYRDMNRGRGYEMER